MPPRSNNNSNNNSQTNAFAYTSASSWQEQIQSFQSSLHSTIEREVNTMKASVYDVQHELDDVESQLDTAREELQKFQFQRGQVNTNYADQIRDAKDGYERRIAGVQASLNALETETSDFKAQLKSLEETKKAYLNSNSGAVAHKAMVDELQEQVARLRNDIHSRAGAEGRVRRLVQSSGTLEDMKAEEIALRRRVEGVEVDIESQSASVKALEEKTASAQRLIDMAVAARSKNAELKKQIASLRAVLTTQQAEMDSLIFKTKQDEGYDSRSRKTQNAELKVLEEEKAKLQGVLDMISKVRQQIAFLQPYLTDGDVLAIKKMREMVESAEITRKSKRKDR
eukprot:PhF_6_TR28112/c0_g1_i3/m.41576